MNTEDLNTFEKTSGQLISVYDEMTLLSKKSPDGAVNKFKLKFVNSLLSQSNDFLQDIYKPFDDFDLFDEDDVPQNSDVVFILSQYLQCFEKYRSDNVSLKSGRWCWRLIGDKNIKGQEDGYRYVQTVKPKKLKD